MFRLNRVVVANKAQFARQGSTSSKPSRRVGVAAAASVAAVVFGTSLAFTSGDVLHPPNYDFAHKGPLTAYDHASIRRGFQGSFNCFPYFLSH